MTIYEFSRASIDHPERNEDATLVYTGEGRAPLFVAIDGMGGQQHPGPDGTMVTGREAAQLVRQTLLEDLAHLPVDVDASPGGIAEQKAIAAVIRAHQRVRLEANQGDDWPPHQRVGAVVTVVIVCENGARLLTVQVGDTRGYLFTEGDLIQICPDEDNIEYFIRRNLMSAEDGAIISDILNTFDGIGEPDVKGTVTISGDPYELYIAWRWFWVGNNVLGIPAANIVINALGVHDADPVPLTSRIEVTPGDILFLCSDGVYKNLSVGEMSAGLQMDGDTASLLGEQAYARSQDPTNRRSTQDDVSAVVVRLSELQTPPPI